MRHHPSLSSYSCECCSYSILNVQKFYTVAVRCIKIEGVGQTHLYIQMEPSDKKYSLIDIFHLLGKALILFHDKTIKVDESDTITDTSSIKRVALVDYIVRAVADELVQRSSESKEAIVEAILATEMDFDEFTYPDETKSVAIYNDIR